MDERTCARCGVRFNPARATAVYCSLACKKRARGARAEARKRKPRQLHPCDVCGAETINPRYCSPRCVRAAKAERNRVRYQTDPDHREQKRAYYEARARAAGVKPANRRSTCEVPDCERKHLARGMCHKHYNADRRKSGVDGDNPELLLYGMARLYGTGSPKEKVVRCKVTIGLVARCPWCETGMGATGPATRVCPACSTTVEFNAEEVSWVISETHSTARLTQTAA